jgi:3-phosphoshikimate 1-carboxyvinyltransferase
MSRLKAQVKMSNKDINGKLKLSGSKSISNRLLIMQALSASKAELKNLSDSDDTIIMKQALASELKLVDIGMTGTAMRFLTAYFAIQNRETILSGAPRMKKRPIKDLVNALRELGADISYLEKEGFPPLKISGKELEGGTIVMQSSISSQFISALLMIAPLMKKGLQLRLDGELLSRPYIQMTLSLMQEQGINYTWEDNLIQVEAGSYQNTIASVESDWSSISYIYEVLALADSGKIEIESVDENSVQGDQKLMEFFKHFGISSAIENSILKIEKEANFILPASLEIDCEATPDLAQTFAPTACALGVHLKMTGLKNLPFKESNRLEAIKLELEKIGATTNIIDNEALEIIPGADFSQLNLEFDTHHDHRMALSLAPLALKAKHLIINDAEVVNKSYKSFWKDLGKLSFDITFVED